MHLNAIEAILKDILVQFRNDLSGIEDKVIHLYPKRICVFFDKPHRKGKMIEEVRNYFSDFDKSRFVLLRVGLSYLTNQQLSSTICCQ